MSPRLPTFAKNKGAKVGQPAVNQNVPAFRVLLFDCPSRFLISRFEARPLQEYINEMPSCIPVCAPSCQISSDLSTKRAGCDLAFSETAGTNLKAVVCQHVGRKMM